MRHRTDPRVLLVMSASADSGKTTFLESLIPELRETGLRVGVVKRTHHDVDLDVPGKDSHRLREAGAVPVVLRGPRMTTLFAPTPVGDELQTLVAAAAAFGPLDLVLVEGGREIPAQARIEVVAEGGDVVSPRSLLLAIVADHEVGPAGVPRFPRGDATGLARLVTRWVQG